MEPLTGLLRDSSDDLGRHFAGVAQPGRLTAVIVVVGIDLHGDGPDGRGVQLWRRASPPPGATGERSSPMRSSGGGESTFIADTWTVPDPSPVGRACSGGAVRQRRWEITVSQGAVSTPAGCPSGRTALSRGQRVIGGGTYSDAGGCLGAGRGIRRAMSCDPKSVVTVRTATPDFPDVPGQAT